MRAAGQLVRRLARPLVRLAKDVADRGARPRSGADWFGLLKVGLPAALGAIAPIVGPIHGLLADHPAVNLVVGPLVPGTLSGVCVYCVVAHEPAPHVGGFQPERQRVEMRYKYTQAVRWTSKIAFVVLAVLALLALRRLVPVRPGMIGGYVCGASPGISLAGAEVQAINAAGSRVGVPSPVDQTGFFVLEGLPRGLPIVNLAVDAEVCKGAVRVPLDDGRTRFDGCWSDAEGDENRERHGGPWRTWIVRCE